MVFIAFGANVAGRWGRPEQAIRRALEEIEARGATILAASVLYLTKAHGKFNQPDFLNGVAVISTTLFAESLLRMLKALEREAGRLPTPKAQTGKWTPRPLD